MKSVIVHYQELALKGHNRPWFVDRLKHNLKVATAGLDISRVRTLMGRIEIVLGPAARWEEVASRLETVCGVANFSWAGRTSSDLETLGAAIVADLGDRSPASFRVAARRSDKRYPIPSPEIEKRLGARIKGERGWAVNLSAPELTVHVEVLNDRAFYFFGKQRGVGGLPVGVSGRVACLLSGGIDSPVAAWRLIRRGCRAQLIHFHGYPFQTTASQDKARALAEILTRYQLRSRLYLVPFGEVQRQVVVSVPAPIRVVDLPAADAPNRRASGVVGGRAGPGHRRLGRAGGVADARQSRGHRVGGHAAGVPAAGGDGQGRGHRRRPTHRHLRDLHPARRGLLPAVHAPKPADPGHQRRGRCGGGIIALADLIELAVSGASVEDFRWPMVQSTARRLHNREGAKAQRREGTLSMSFASVEELVSAVSSVATIDGDAISVTGQAGPELIDRLAHTAAFGATPEIKGTARWVIRALAAAQGVRPSSMHDLYLAMGRGEAGGFTVPAMNIRDGDLLHGARGVPRGQAGRSRRLHLRDRAVRDRLHRAAPARVRGGGAGRGAARRARRPGVLPGRSRPGEPEEVQVARSRQGARGAADADPRGDRGRLLQHRHRHLDARGSRQDRRSTNSRR